MSYFRHHYVDFQEFQREACVRSEGFGVESLGKEELDLLEDIEDEDAFDKPRRRRDWE